MTCFQYSFTPSLIFHLTDPKISYIQNCSLILIYIQSTQMGHNAHALITTNLSIHTSIPQTHFHIQIYTLYIYILYIYTYITIIIQSSSLLSLLRKSNIVILIIIRVICRYDIVTVFIVILGFDEIVSNTMILGTGVHYISTSHSRRTS